MEKYLKLSFADEKGITCERCMLSFIKGEKEHCAALGTRPLCPEEGHLRECPLRDITDMIETTNQ